MTIAQSAPDPRATQGARASAINRGTPSDHRRDLVPVSLLLATQPTAVARTYTEARELERRRIARDLHDVVGQALTSALLSLGGLEQRLGPAGPSVEVEQARDALMRALNAVRTVALDLRPAVLDELGLIPALRWSAARGSRDSRYRVVFTAASLPDRLDPVIETACFRVCQEALTNIARHAHARRVDLAVSVVDRQLILSVRDDGRGCDVGRAVAGVASGENLGLATMSEFVQGVDGVLELGSAPGGGTELRATFPLARTADRRRGTGRRR